MADEFLDVGAQEAHFTGGEFLHVHGVGREHAEAHHFVVAGAGHEMDDVAELQGPVHDAEEHHDALIAVVPGIEDEGLERRAAVALGCGQPMHDGVEHLVDVEAGFGGNVHGIGAVEADGIFNFLMEQKKKGRIRHLGFSTHGDINCITRFLEAYGEHMEFCQIELNYCDYRFQNAKGKGKRET